MQTRSKLAILQLASGIVGWVWILASLASIYFVVAALAFDGLWSSFFWAFGTSVVAKWLARGFADNQKRVAYEAELVSRGLSPEEAHQTWLQSHMQDTPSLAPYGADQATALGNSSEAALLEAQELVNKYGAVLEHSKAVLRSESVLPAPKDDIKNALVGLARHSRASGASSETIEPLRVGYASLADFVSEGDAEASNTFDSLAASGAAELDDADLLELAAKMSEVGAAAVYANSQSTEEFALLAAEFDERIRE